MAYTSFFDKQRNSLPKPRADKALAEYDCLKHTATK
jgi:hypothetical protein